MNEAVTAYLACAGRGGAHARSVAAAAEAVDGDPWTVIAQAGPLARARQVQAATDLGLNARLRVIPVDDHRVIARISAGQPYPTFDVPGRRRRGAYDTPASMAREVVRATIAAATGSVGRGRDPACGTGAFLVAMTEAGVPEVRGTDLDEAALAVARVACPTAHVVRGDALADGPQVDVVCGNPPYVSPEHQDRELRAVLRKRFSWLSGRFDLAIPFAAVAAERVREGGGCGLVLPFAALVQPYGAPLRRRWVEQHRVAWLSGPHPFPGVGVPVGCVAVQVGGGPAPVAPHGVPAAVLLRLAGVPLTTELRPGDVEIVEAMRTMSIPLGELCTVDTGLVAHSPEGGKARLISDEPGPGRVPFADAREFFAGAHRWIEYTPERMHRPKSPGLFEPPKLVIQRLRGRRAVRVAVDRRGIYVGHTCTVVLPRDPRLDLDRLCELVQSPLVDGFTRIERGQRLDLYPHDVAAIPIPRAWLADPGRDLGEAFGLGPDRIERLAALASAVRE